MSIVLLARRTAVARGSKRAKAFNCRGAQDRQRETQPRRLAGIYEFFAEVG
jgi:hypothetical protein